MKITGIAPVLSRLYDRNCLPADELVYLATQALQFYRPTTLITSLYNGWDQALAKAALNIKIPCHVVLPYRKHEAVIRNNAPDLSRDLLPKSNSIECLTEAYHDNADMECHIWRAARADMLLALWDYEFCGETFQVIDFALKAGKQVINLWEDWSRLYSLRCELAAIYQTKHASGAQIFPEKS